jgi:hypothetical protein
MDSKQILYVLLGNLVTQIPVIILLIIGIILSFVKWSKHPKVAKFSLGGLGVLVLAILINLGLSFLRIQLPLMLDGNYQLIGYINVGISFIENLIWTFGLALLIVAVWAGRSKNHESLAK